MEWVSIKDRLPADGLETEPETDINVLINITKGEESSIIPCEFNIGFNSFMHDDWRLNDGGWDITHWMLFPKPPKEI